MKLQAIGISFTLALLGASSSGAGERISPLRAIALRCDDARDCLGVDELKPRLSWKLASSVRGDLQTSFQILVASSPQLLAVDTGDLWDSGQQVSANLQMRYAGKPLASSQQVFWKMRLWNKDKEVSAWSEPAKWTMGLLAEADWKTARWIGASEGNGAATLVIRREFDVKPALRRAIIHVCGLGQYELTLNGKRVTDDLLTPGWTDYRKTCLYDTYDLTALMRAGGRNALGLLLGHGMYDVDDSPSRYYKFTNSFGPLKAVALVRLDYEDGSSEFIGSDGDWRLNAGPITFSNVFGGEDFDARLVQPGWDEPGFHDASWEAPLVCEGPGGKLRGQSAAAPSIRAFDVFQPLSQTVLHPKEVASPAGSPSGLAVEKNKHLSSVTTVYDLGQNASMMPRVVLRGPVGSTVKITPAELINSDGSVNRDTVGRKEAYWKVTLAGTGGSEPYFPKFFYHGCRYLQVECSAADPSDDPPTVESIEGVVVHSSAEAVGEFSCSNDLFNRIRTLVRWAQRSNMMSVLTDCPHRERLGWLEQTHLNGPALRYEFGLDQFFAKVINDMAESQQSNGLVPNIAPEFVVFKGAFRDSPEWGSALLLVAEQQYEWTGNADALERCYEAMKRYVDYLTSRAENGIVSHGLGDWYDLGPKPPGRAQLTPVALTATAFYFQDATVLAHVAKLLGKPGDSKHYGDLAAQIREAFTQTFFNRETHQYGSGSQTANALALAMELAEPSSRSAVLENLVKDVRDRGNAVSAGDVGYRYLLRALAEGGRSDVIFDINNQSEKPGYGMMLARGATALTEAWDQKGAHGGSSQNHFMLGQVTEWFYRDLAGIAPDPAGPGFARVVIHPHPVGDVTWAKASYDSARGKISAEWEKRGADFQLAVSLPPGSTGTVFIPASKPDAVTESGTRAARASNVKFIRFESGEAVFEIGSGGYRFVSRD